MKNIYIYLIVCIACTPQTKERAELVRIDLQAAQKMDIAACFDSMEIIPLETTSASLFH